MTAEPLHPLQSKNQGPGWSLPGPDAGHPLQGAGGGGANSRGEGIEIARDLYGMILGDMVGVVAESPGSKAATQGVTFALENRQLRSVGSLGAA